MNIKFLISFIFFYQFGLSKELIPNNIDKDPTLYNFSFIAPLPDTIDEESLVNTLNDYDFSNTDTFTFEDKSYSKIDVTAQGYGQHSVFQLFPNIKENELIIAVADVYSETNQLVYGLTYDFYLKNKVYFNKNLFYDSYEYSELKYPSIEITKGINRFIKVIKPTGAVSYLHIIFPESRRMITGKIAM